MEDNFFNLIFFSPQWTPANVTFAYVNDRHKTLMHAHDIKKQKNVIYMYFGIMTLIVDFVAFEHVWA